MSLVRPRWTQSAAAWLGGRNTARPRHAGRKAAAGGGSGGAAGQHKSVMARHPGALNLPPRDICGSSPPCADRPHHIASAGASPPIKLATAPSLWHLSATQPTGPFQDLPAKVTSDDSDARRLFQQEDLLEELSPWPGWILPGVFGTGLLCSLGVSASPEAPFRE